MWLGSFGWFLWERGQQQLSQSNQVEKLEKKWQAFSQTVLWVPDLACSVHWTVIILNSLPGSVWLSNANVSEKSWSSIISYACPTFFVFSTVFKWGVLLLLAQGVPITVLSFSSTVKPNADSMVQSSNPDLWATSQTCSIKVSKLGHRHKKFL